MTTVAEFLAETSPYYKQNRYKFIQKQAGINDFFGNVMGRAFGYGIANAGQKPTISDVWSNTVVPAAKDKGKEFLLSELERLGPEKFHARYGQLSLLGIKNVIHNTAYSQFREQVTDEKIIASILEKASTDPRMNDQLKVDLENYLKSTPEGQQLVSGIKQNIFDKYKVPMNASDSAPDMTTQDFTNLYNLKNNPNNVLSEKEVEDISNKTTAGFINHKIEDTDLISNDIVPQGMTEAEFLGTGAYGNDPVFKQLYGSFYKPGKESNTNVAGFALLQDIANNKELADLAINNYQGLDENQRKTSLLENALRNVANELSKYGKHDEAKKLMEQANNLSKNLGTQGGNLVGTETIAEYVQQAAQQANKTLQEASPEYYKKLQDQYNARKLTDEQNQQIHNYWQQNVGDKRLNNSYYGMFGGQGAQSAMQYASPWLAYGVPLAGMMSMFGNHSAWMPVLFGGLASAAYGGLRSQGYFQDFANSDIGKAYDNITQWMTNPIANLTNQYSVSRPLTQMYNGSVYAQNNRMGQMRQVGQGMDNVYGGGNNTGSSGSNMGGGNSMSGGSSSGGNNQQTQTAGT